MRKYIIFEKSVLNRFLCFRVRIPNIFASRTNSQEDKLNNSIVFDPNNIIMSDIESNDYITSTIAQGATSDTIPANPKARAKTKSKGPYRLYTSNNASKPHRSNKSLNSEYSKMIAINPKFFL